MQIVWFSEIKWNYLKTRKQQIISRKPTDVQLLFLEPFVRSGRNSYRLRSEGDIYCATIPFLKSAPYFPWRTVLDRRMARYMVDFIALNRIRYIFKQIGFDPADTGFVLSNIYAANILPRLKRRFLLYDCNDDHSSFPGMRSWTKAYFYKTSREADGVFASSDALLDKVTDVRGNSEQCAYLGNGVDYNHFQATAEPARPDTGDNKPRLGYIGALAPWFDFDTIAGLAKAQPGWEIVLVGPILLGVEAQVMELTSLPNVFHLPAVSYGQLPGVLEQFDLGLIPFRYNELTRGVNPNKMYEYLACGLPVVATRFSAEVQKYPELVRAVDGGESFNEACGQVLSTLNDRNESEAIARRARNIAQDNDWSVIASTFWNRAREMMGG